MVSLGFKAGIILLMITCGAINTVDFKFQNTEYVYEGAVYKYFFHPYIQTLIMFLAESMSLLVLWSLKARTPQVYLQRAKEAEAGGKVLGMNKLYLFIPAFFDLLSSTMQFMALNFIPASAYQMLRGGTIITTFLFSLLLLRQKVLRAQLVGTGIALLGILVVGVSNTIYSTTVKQQDTSMQIVGYVLIIVSLFTNGLFFASEQKLMSKYYLEPLEVVGYEGIFGFIAYLGIVPFFSHLPCNFGKPACVFDSTGRPYIEGWTMFWHHFTTNYWLLFLVLSSLLSTMLFNVAGVTITKHINALARAIADVSKTILVWIASIVVTVEWGSTYPNYSWELLDPTLILLQLVGFIFLILGNVVYNEIIPCPCITKQSLTTPILTSEHQQS